MARISQLYDPLNDITVDAAISPKCVGEREMAANHFLSLMPNDLMLMDGQRISGLVAVCIDPAVHERSFLGPYFKEVENPPYLFSLSKNPLHHIFAGAHQLG
ncbi:MAG: hypothetical protein JRH18_20735 [Deltaproteobacteria bacterium]|nr:hypothetical protein [Deltaproteobacteria bacterium]MBW2154079.1 hypothetical protein [Deltaproteobacteria bacterium]